MRIEVRELEVGSVLRTPFAESVASESDEVTLDEPVVGQIEVSRMARGVFVSGQVATTTALVCGRCLEPYRQHLDVAFNEEFTIDAAHEPLSAGELDSDDVTVPLDPSGSLEVNEVIRQHLLLAVPMVPLCAPTCRGLCPQCGANWNRQSCTCRQETIDPRLAPLLQFREGTPDTRKRGSKGST